MLANGVFAENFIECSLQGRIGLALHLVVGPGRIEVTLADDLVFRILQVLEEGPEPLVDWDLHHPTSLIRSLLADSVGKQLDAMSAIAFEEIVDEVRQSWGAETLEA